MQLAKEAFRQDVGSTKGGRAMEDGTVMMELANHLKHSPNISCRVEKFGNVVEQLCSTKRQWVKEMGFGSMLELVDIRLPRSLCYWLATRVDSDSKELVTADGVKFPLSKVQVHCVFGLPYGPFPIPNKVRGHEMAQEVQEIWELYESRTKGGTKELNGKAIEEGVTRPPEDARHFKRAFLMFLLNEVLCPTTSNRLSPKLLPAATLYFDAKNYDWCSLVLDHLFFYLRRFSESFQKHGFARGCGGCTYFIAIFYLDRLKRPPLEWGVYPRIIVWSKKEVHKVQNDDQTMSGDFGKVGVGG